MKLTEIKIFSKSLVICTCFFGMLLFSCGSNEDVAQSKEDVERIIPSIVVKNVRMNSSGTIDGKVTYSTIKDVSFSKSGKLEKGDVPLSVGTHFKFNELLVQLNIEEAFRELAQSKLSFAKKIQSFEVQIEKKIPSVLIKWKKFKEDLTPSKRLPQFPIIYSEAEKALIIENDIYILFTNLRNQESEIENYFYLAPFNGVITAVNVKHNSKVRKNQTVLKIAKDAFYNAEFIVSQETYQELKQRDDFDFLGINEDKIGFGKIKKAIQSDSKMKLICSFQKVNGKEIVNNQLIRISLPISKSKGCYLPKTAVKSGKVLVLSNGKEIKTKVKILKEQNEQVFVSGLKDGSIVLIK
jgi:hypothetical protein